MITYKVVVFFHTGSLFIYFFWCLQSLSAQSLAQKHTKKQRLILGMLLGWISCLLPHQPPSCSGHVCRLITSIGAAKDSNSPAERKLHGSFTPCPERGSPASRYQDSIFAYIFSFILLFFSSFFSDFSVSLPFFSSSLSLHS